MSAGIGYLWRPENSGAAIVLPDAAALDITGDIDLATLVRLPDYTPVADVGLFGKFLETGDERSFAFAITSGGNLQLQWSPDGEAAALITQASTSSLPSAQVLSGEMVWVRATLNVDNEASGYVLKFFSGFGDVDAYPNWWDSSVNSLGNTITGGAVTSIHAGTADVEIGAFNEANDSTELSVMRAMLWSGMQDTLVLDLNFADVNNYNAARTELTDLSANGFTVALSGNYVVVPAWDGNVFPLMGAAQLVAHWNDENGAYGPAGANPWADLSGNNHHLTPELSAFASNAWPLPADSYLEAASTAGLNLADDVDFTLAVRCFIPVTTGSIFVLAGKKASVDASDPGYLLYVDADGDLVGLISDGTTQVSVSRSMPANQWVVAALVRDVTAETIEVFTNGTASGSPTSDTTAYTLSNYVPFRIGDFGDTPAAENRILYSEQFDHASWTKANSSIVADQAQIPGLAGTTADQIVENAAAASVHLINRTYSRTSGVTYTIGIRAKFIDRAYLTINAGVLINASGYFNLQTGVIGTFSGSAAMESLGDGWYLCKVTGTASATGNGQVYFQMAQDDNDESYDGDGTSSMLMGAAQICVGSDLKPYATTTDTEVV